MDKATAEDKRWADSKEQSIRRILEGNAMHMIDIRIADDEADMKRATDLVVTVAEGDIACRLRRSNCRYRDWTIRSKRANGAETELSKLRKGFARWYLYGWEGPSGNIDEWMLIDLDKVRADGLLDKPRQDQLNKDGTTYFVSIGSTELVKGGYLTAYQIDGLPYVVNTSVPVTKTVVPNLPRYRTEQLNLFEPDVRRATLRRYR